MTAARSIVRDQAFTRDEDLQTALRQRGWVSNRYLPPEDSDEFEWPASRPTSPEQGTVATGTVIYLEPGVYLAFAPQRDEAWTPPRAG